ncbi:MAG: DUF996 domain-containing protein [Thaumarchaeota archaeon]|nr:DUF996 domain-containing protein [Nitrososphaerota archaeon]
MSLSQAKTLGQVGSILAFIPVLNIIGYILILVSIRDVAKSVQDRSVFTNMMIAVVLQIAGVAVGLFIVFAGLASSVMTAGTSALVGVFGGLAALWICFVLAAYFLRKSYATMATKLGTPQFGTAGLLILIGSLLVIILVGFLVIFVAYIFQAIAFFSMREQYGANQPSQPLEQRSVQPPGSSTVVPPYGTLQRYCPSCGSPVDDGARFCRHCGKTL